MELEFSGGVGSGRRLESARGFGSGRGGVVPSGQGTAAADAVPKNFISPDYGTPALAVPPGDQSDREEGVGRWGWRGPFVDTGQTNADVGKTAKKGANP